MSNMAFSYCLQCPLQHDLALSLRMRDTRDRTSDLYHVSYYNPPFSGVLTRICGFSILGLANAHLRIFHFRASERTPLDPRFSGGRTRTCGYFIFGRANTHLRMQHFQAGEGAPGDPPF